MKKPFTGLWLAWALLLLVGQAPAQGYFQNLEKPAKTYHKKIGRFPNGDILIGDSSLDSQNSLENRGVFLTRIDPCGNAVWAKSYGWKENYMEFKDLAIDEAGNVFVYGSAYEGFDELVFLIKLDGNGLATRFKLLRTGTVDHFTYAIELKNNRLMAYGLLLDWDSQKQGFIAMFDTDLLNFQWGLRFAPFESIGDARITADGGFICRSGPYLMRLNGQGALQWAIAPPPDLKFYPVAGPFEAPGGYIMEYYREGFAFFYLIDDAGNLAWKSPKFLSTRHPADLDLLPDGSFSAVYSRIIFDGSRPGRMVLSPEGEILGQFSLSADPGFNTGLVDQQIDRNGMVNLVGNADEFALAPGQPNGFLLQFDAGAPDGDCFEWTPVADRQANDIAASFEAYQPIFSDFAMTELPGNILQGDLDYFYRETCDLYLTDTVKVDTSLLCGQHWSVSLPGPGFRWKDGVRANPRPLDAPGVYLAANNDCLDPVVYKYEVRRQPCPCEVYLPTAFSPNGDGLNDRLEIYSNCTLRDTRMQVFDRWGDLVFDGPAWNGKIRDRAAPEAVYVVKVSYSLMDETGDTHTGQLAQGVVLTL